MIDFFVYCLVSLFLFFLLYCVLMYDFIIIIIVNNMLTYSPGLHTRVTGLV